MYPYVHYFEENGMKLLSIDLSVHVTTLMLFTLRSLKIREYENRSLFYKVLICDDGGLLPLKYKGAPSSSLSPLLPLATFCLLCVRIGVEGSEGKGELLHQFIKPWKTKFNFPLHYHNNACFAVISEQYCEPCLPFDFFSVFYYL